MRRWLKVALIVIALLIALAVGAFVIWGLTPLGPGDVALRALQSTSSVTVTTTEGGGFEFAPRSAEATRALVLYPGGHVDVRSYAPLASTIASYGYLVVVVRMPLALAVLDPDAADKAIESHPEIESWSVGGHSLGGAMAAQYAAETPGRLDALVLLAAYAPIGADLSGSDLEVLDIVGSLDGVIDRQAHEAGARLLPPDTAAETLEGGNHAQFGDYGPQPGDNPATITPAEQWRVTAQRVNATLEAGASSR